MDSSRCVSGFEIHKDITCICYCSAWHTFPDATDRSNTYMKVQLAKLKADDEKAGVKGDHKVGCTMAVLCRQTDVQERFKKVAKMWKTA